METLNNAEIRPGETKSYEVTFNRASATHNLQDATIVLQIFKDGLVAAQLAIGSGLTRSGNTEAQQVVIAELSSALTAAMQGTYDYRWVITLASGQRPFRQDDYEGAFIVAANRKMPTALGS